MLCFAQVSSVEAESCEEQAKTYCTSEFSLKLPQWMRIDDCVADEDETGLCDDPSKKKTFCTKYCDKKQAPIKAYDTRCQNIKYADALPEDC